MRLGKTKLGESWCICLVISLEYVIWLSSKVTQQNALDRQHVAPGRSISCRYNLQKVATYSFHAITIVKAKPSAF